jgi:hypothetical protein
MRQYESWDEPPPGGDSAWFKWFAALWVLAVGGISAVIIFGTAAPPNSPVAENTSEAAQGRRVDASDTSYSGYRGRTLGINGDGANVQLDHF